MAQHDYVIANGTGAAVRSDLNNALAAIVSQNSGATAPSTTYAYQWWADTTTGLLKLRNAANNAWITLFQLDGEWSTLAVENGSAAAPSIYFKDSGTDTGIYSPGSDQVAITTGGTGRLFIDSSGRLLVGTSTARSNFFGTTLSSLTQTEGTGGSTARGSLSVINNDVSNNPPYVLLGRSGAATLGSNAAVVSGSRLGTVSFHGADGSSFIEAATVAGEVDGTPGTNDMPGRLVFSTTADGAASPTERLRIDSSGRVGLGTSSPSVALHVSGATNAAAQIRSSNTTSSVDTVLVSETTGVLRTNTNHSLQLGTNSTTAVTIDTSQRVGIGTSPSTKLHVAGSGQQIVRVQDTGNTNGLDIGNNTTESFVSTADNKPITFYTNNLERAKIDASGRLLVGTSTSPSAGEGQYARIVAQGNTSSATGGAYVSLQRGEAATAITAEEELGLINFGDSAGNTFGTIACRADATAGSGDYPGRLSFSVTRDGAASPTEALRISNTGAVSHSCNRADWGFQTLNQNNSSSNYGLAISCGTNAATGTNYAVNIADGDNDNQGYITFTGGTVTYGAFTAHHPCILPDADNEAGYPYGTLLEITSIEYTQKDGQDTERGILYNVRKTQSANSRAVLGAYGSSMNGGPSGETNRHQALVLGDGHILCNGSGGNIKLGDGICSSAVAGIGQKATATPSMIIGIAQEDVTFDGDETKLVPVQYGLQQFIPWQE
jgi:hypothetical protein